MRNLLFLPALMLVIQSTGCRPAAERKPPSETAHAPDSSVADTLPSDAIISAPATGDGGGFVDWVAALPVTDPARRRALSELPHAANADTGRYAAVFAWGSSPRVLVRTNLTKMYLGQSGPALFAIDNSAATVSPAYGFGDEENVLVRDLSDYDGDGAADVVICAWYEAQDEPVFPRVLGYRAGMWYKIAHPIPVPPSCMAAG
jgi:hypothetical protein